VALTGIEGVWGLFIGGKKGGARLVDKKISIGERAGGRKSSIAYQKNAIRGERPSWEEGERFAGSKKEPLFPLDQEPSQPRKEEGPIDGEGIWEKAAAPR